MSESTYRSVSILGKLSKLGQEDREVAMEAIEMLLGIGGIAVSISILDEDAPGDDEDVEITNEPAIPDHDPFHYLSKSF